MQVYIEYFQARSREITNRLDTLTSPVNFRPITTTSRLGYGILECAEPKELERVKQNLIDLINEELNKEDFIEKVKGTNKVHEKMHDPVTGEEIDIFQTKSNEQVLKEIEE